VHSGGVGRISAWAEIRLHFFFPHIPCFPMSRPHGASLFSHPPTTVVEPYVMLWLPELQLDREGTNATEWVVEGVLEDLDSMGPYRNCRYHVDFNIA
jgi:hypothetical protein